MSLADFGAFLGGASKEAAAIKQERLTQENLNLDRAMTIYGQLIADPNVPDTVREAAYEAAVQGTLGAAGYKKTEKGKPNKIQKIVEQFVGTIPGVPVGMQGVMDAAAASKMDRGPGTGSGGAMSSIGGGGVATGPVPQPDPAVATQMQDAQIAETGTLTLDVPSQAPPAVQPIPQEPVGYVYSPEQQSRITTQIKIDEQNALAEAELKNEQEAVNAAINQLRNNPDFAGLADYLEANPHAQADMLAQLGFGIRVPDPTDLTFAQESVVMVEEAYAAEKDLQLPLAPEEKMDARVWGQDQLLDPNETDFGHKIRLLRGKLAGDPDSTLVYDALFGDPITFSHRVSIFNNILQSSTVFGDIEEDTYMQGRAMAMEFLNVEDLPTWDEIQDLITRTKQ